MTIEQRLERIERTVTLAFKKVLNVSDMALMLGVSESRVRHIASERQLPYYKTNGRIYFDREEVERHLKSNRYPSQQEIDSKAATRIAVGRIK